MSHEMECVLGACLGAISVCLFFIAIELRRIRSALGGKK